MKPKNDDIGIEVFQVDFLPGYLPAYLALGDLLSDDRIFPNEENRVIHFHNEYTDVKACQRFLSEVEQAQANKTNGVWIGIFELSPCFTLLSKFLGNGNIAASQVALFPLIERYPIWGLKLAPSAPAAGMPRRSSTRTSRTRLSPVEEGITLPLGQYTKTHLKPPRVIIGPPQGSTVFTFAYSELEEQLQAGDVNYLVAPFAEISRRPQDLIERARQYLGQILHNPDILVLTVDVPRKNTSMHVALRVAPESYQFTAIAAHVQHNSGIMAGWTQVESIGCTYAPRVHSYVKSIVRHGDEEAAAILRILDRMHCKLGSDNIVLKEQLGAPSLAEMSHILRELSRLRPYAVNPIEVLRRPLIIHSDNETAIRHAQLIGDAFNATFTVEVKNTP